MAITRLVQFRDNSLKGFEEKIAIIGLGRLGTSLLRALTRVEFRVVAVSDVNHDRIRNCAKFSAQDIHVFEPHAVPENVSLIFLTVPDDRIADVVHKLRQSPHLSFNTVVSHCSGIESSAILKPLKPRTRLLVSLHPLQTFPGGGDDWRSLFGIHYGAEGDPQAIERLSLLVRALKSDVFTITAEQKTLYHLACVFASNYLVGLVSAAVDVFARIGFSEQPSVAYLMPLIQKTVENIEKNGPAKALSGPAVRGDLGAISRHLEAMDVGMTEYKDIYLSLGRQLLKMIDELQNENLSALEQNQKEKLKEIFIKK